MKDITLVNAMVKHGLSKKKALDILQEVELNNQLNVLSFEVDMLIHYPHPKTKMITRIDEDDYDFTTSNIILDKLNKKLKSKGFNKIEIENVEIEYL